MQHRDVGLHDRAGRVGNQAAVLESVVFLLEDGCGIARAGRAVDRLPARALIAVDVPLIGKPRAFGDYIERRRLPLDHVLRLRLANDYERFSERDGTLIVEIGKFVAGIVVRDREYDFAAVRAAEQPLRGNIERVAEILVDRADEGVAEYGKMCIRDRNSTYRSSR